MFLIGKKSLVKSNLRSLPVFQKFQDRNEKNGMLNKISEWGHYLTSNQWDRGVNIENNLI
jgi:hypothetical protein